MKSNDTSQPLTFIGTARLKLRPKLYVAIDRQSPQGVAKPRARLKLIQVIHTLNVFARRTTSGSKISSTTIRTVRRVIASPEIRLHGSVYELPLPKDCIALKEWRSHQAQ